MGSVAQAVLEFDEAVQVPWRPPLSTATSRPALTVAVGPMAPPRRARAARAGRLAPGSPPAAAPPRGRPERRPGRRRGVVCPRCDSLGPCGPGPLRLTGRGRRLLALVAGGGAVAAAAWLGGVVQEDHGLRLAGEVSTVVEPGDTLWSIARSVAGDADVRQVVDEIQRINDLEGTGITPGQVLELP